MAKTTNTDTEKRKEQLKEAQARFVEKKKRLGFVKMQVFVKKGFIQKLQRMARDKGFSFDDFMNEFIRTALMMEPRGAKPPRELKSGGSHRAQTARTPPPSKKGGR